MLLDKDGDKKPDERKVLVEGLDRLMRPSREQIVPASLLATTTSFAEKRIIPTVKPF